MVTDGDLVSVIKNRDNFIGLKILRNKGEFAFLLSKFLNGEPLKKSRKDLLKSELLELTMDSCR